LHEKISEIVAGGIFLIVFSPLAAAPAEETSQFNGRFRTEFDNVYTISFPVGSETGTIERNQKGIVTRGKATLYRGGKEIRFELPFPKGQNIKGLITHFEGDIYHLFLTGNRTTNRWTCGG
jgi:hypothetical protein